MMYFFFNFGSSYSSFRGGWGLATGYFAELVNSALYLYIHYENSDQTSKQNKYHQ